ncbi:Hemolysin-type calcium-binding repeat-containing protein [Paracoccus saliphilus]|uniref:Hemolysin-type calcium-binding repeat-containing protein n=2 Tax=Paracoccus saliphilus TaxID=405559 RepID=A0AA46A6T4_9RHOB|nr:Hemolysin-type calcium-binding repeat-containing protein [Paracoccus saliphilus]
MLDEYTMQLWSWWALFGATLALGLSLGNDDDDNSSGPEPDPDHAPFEGLEDFNPEAYEDFTIGTPGQDDLVAEAFKPTAMAGGADDDIIKGSNLDDYILGGFGDDGIRGEPGNDIIRAGEGNDNVHAGFGDDLVFGDAGNDTINGGHGDDGIAGGEGDDNLFGWGGSDVVLGGAGDDTLSGLRMERAAPRDAAEAEQDGPDTLEGGEGNDQLWLSDGDNGTGGEGEDSFIADWRSDDITSSVTINDYNADEDQIALLINSPEEGQDLPEITQEITENGEDRLVFMDGVEIARVVGAGSGDELDIATLTESPNEDAQAPA